jgi:RNA polymerase sigma factor (sigma-70 family)
METSVASDSELLTAWVAHRREAAFHALVARYATLVHMTAKRTCGDDSLAADASQLVFILLAQKAKSLATHPTLAGWLHVTAVRKTRDLIDKSQRESRKRRHLQVAMETNSSNPPSDTWQEMQPVLDQALAALSDKDREAILLRFYRSLTIREIATTLGIATDAAQKRLDRATERLRGKLARRGVQTSGTLSAAMLAGFAADAQAALPISILASKAIAAGTVSSFSLAAIITSIAALMKSSSLIPPVVALILAGAWTGTKYHSLSATEARNEVLRHEIAQANTTKTPATVKLTEDDRPIDWQKLASEKGNGPEFQRFQKRLTPMSQEDLIATLDQIAALELSNTRRSELESAVITPLMEIDPEWVLNHFTDRLREALPLPSAFELWAKKDLVKATAWLDAQIAAGNLDSKRLDDTDGRQQPRNAFEFWLIDVLLASDPAAAARRLSSITEKQRQLVMSSLANSMSNWVLNEPLTEGNHLAFANLVRSQLPVHLQVPMLADCLPYTWDVEEFPKFNAYMDVIEATPEERISCAEAFAENRIRDVGGRPDVTLDDLEALRGDFAKISPQNVDTMTARSLAAAVKGTTGFSSVSGLAVGLQERSGSDAVLATFLEIVAISNRDKELGRKLAGKVSDETRRAEILKRFN